MGHAHAHPEQCITCWCCSPPAHSVYVADKGNNRIRKVTSAGVVTTLAGNGTAGWADGTGTNTMFNTPTGIALSSDATTLFVADASTHRSVSACCDCQVRFSLLLCFLALLCLLVLSGLLVCGG